MNKLSMSLAGALLALSAMPAHAADFLGDQIKAAWRGPTSPYTAYPATFSANPLVVGAGIEGFVELPRLHIDIDFAQTMLTLTVRDAGDFSGYAFWGLVFENLTDVGQDFGEVTAVSGIDPSRVQVLGKLLAVNLADLHTTANHNIVVDFAPQVPEPASWALLLTGFGIVGAALRRRPARLAFS